MAKSFDLKTFSDSRGNLTVIEREIPFVIKRIFYIYGVDNSVRGKHRHKTTREFLLALKGQCRVNNRAGKGMLMETFVLDCPTKGLLLEPSDYHYIDHFSPDCILQVFASTYFDPGDYIFDDY